MSAAQGKEMRHRSTCLAVFSTPTIQRPPYPVPLWLSLNDVV